jgi:DHA1 family multidrug resistance protein-like MFS transporter
LFAPISELYGRQVAYHVSQVCFVVFCIGTAVSQKSVALSLAMCCVGLTTRSMATLIVLRFFCGVFGSSGPAIGVATCADVSCWHDIVRSDIDSCASGLGAARARATGQPVRHWTDGKSGRFLASGHNEPSPCADRSSYQAGPVLGSMLGYWILFGGWRWLFWTITILAALNTALLMIGASETNAA